MTLAEIVDDLDAETTDALCVLVMPTEYGPEAVDGWIAEYAGTGCTP
jgi:hypothetical protein